MLLVYTVYPAPPAGSGRYGRVRSWQLPHLGQPIAGRGKVFKPRPRYYSLTRRLEQAPFRSGGRFRWRRVKRLSNGNSPRRSSTRPPASHGRWGASSQRSFEWSATRPSSISRSAVPVSRSDWSIANSASFTDDRADALSKVTRWSYRGQEPELANGESELFAERFPNGVYTDVTGLCKVASIDEIEAQGWSLNPGRYVGTEVEDLDDEVFEEKLAAAHAELRALGGRARDLEAGVDEVLGKLLSG